MASGYIGIEFRSKTDYAQDKALAWYSGIQDDIGA